MKFGIFYELQLPRPWEAGDELRLYQNALTQLETADRLGYDHAWVVEHHFLEEYSHSPSPESFLAAASQRTKNIRLGHGIFQLTTNHPARVAERVAVLDLLSRCRSRIRRCGWPVRSFRPSNAPVRTDLVPSASSLSAPMRRMPGCMPITTRSQNG